MADHDEIKKLRADLDYLLAMAGKMSKRLDALERESKLDAIEDALPKPPVTAVAPPPLPPTPAAPKPIGDLSRPAAPAFSQPIAHASGVPPTTEALEQEWVKAASPPARSVPEVPRAPKPSFEVQFFSVWLPRIGIFLLGIAAVFALGLGVQRFGPGMRVAMSYTTAAVLLGAGFWQERRNPKYGRALFSGGFGLTYFTTFAAHYIPLSKVIHSQPLAIVLMMCVIGLWTAFAQARQSRITAATVTVLAHFTIALALFGAREILGYAAVALVFLSCGSAFFLLRNGWYVIAFVGLVGSYVNHFTWMTRSEGSGTPFEFVLCMLLVTAHFVVFAGSEFAGSPRIRERNVRPWLRTSFVSANTVAYVLLGTLTMKGFTFAEPHEHLFRFLLAAVLLGIGVAYLRLQNADPLYNAYIVKATAMATLGFVALYGESALTASLAVEAVALMYTARRSGLWITRVLAGGMLIIVFLHGLTDIHAAMPYDDPLYSKRAFQCSLTVLAILAAVVIHQRTNWRERQSLPELFRPLGPTPEGYGLSIRLAEGNWVSASTLGYAMFGVILGLVFQLALVQAGHRILSYAAFALALSIAAALARASALGIGSLFAFVAAVFMGGLEILMEYAATSFAMPAVLCLAAIALFSEPVASRYAGLSAHGVPGMPYLLYGGATLMLGLTVLNHFDRALAASTTMVLLAAAMAAATLTLRPMPLAVSATGLLIWAALRWLSAGDVKSDSLYYPSTILLAGALVGFDRYFAWMKNKIFALPLSAILLPTLWVVTIAFLDEHVNGVWMPLAAGLTAYAFLAYAGVFRSGTSGVVAVLGALIATFTTITEAYDKPPSPTLARVLSFLAVAGFWFVCERFGTRSTVGKRVFRQNEPSMILPFAVMALLMAMLHRIPQLAEFLLTVSWSVLSFAGFGLSIYLRHKFYRYASLAVFGIATLRAFVIDAPSLDGFARVGAFFALGVYGLLVSYGYIYLVARIDASEREASVTPTTTDENQP